MKRILSLVLLIAVLSLGLIACTAEEEPTTLRVAAMTGPTGIGLAKLMENDAIGAALGDYDFTIVGKADEITPKLIRGELDMAALPANVAASLYNTNNGDFVTLAVNTLGVLYIVDSTGTVSSLSDLRGKTLYATGKGTTPELALNYLLAQNGMDPATDLNIVWKSEAAEVGTQLLTDGGGIALLPQPYVTIAQTQLKQQKDVTLDIAVSLNDAWEALDNGTSLVTGVMVARRDFVEKHPKAVATFLAEYKSSIEYINANTDIAGDLVVEHGIFAQAPIIKKALPHCNITYLAGAEMKTALSGYLGTLYAQKPASIGGALPGDDFYYGA